MDDHQVEYAKTDRKKYESNYDKIDWGASKEKKIKKGENLCNTCKISSETKICSLQRKRDNVVIRCSNYIKTKQC